jgi:Protein of unknown function (DUF1360)
VTPAAPWFETLLSVLAVWRVAHLLALERGPFDLFSRLHVALQRPGGRGLAALLACPYCLGLWLAALPAAWLGWRDGLALPTALLLWLGIAGGAALLERGFSGPP